MNGRAIKQGLFLAAYLTVFGCGAGDWKTRLQERFDDIAIEHPLVDKAREAHKRALAAETAKQEHEARSWALAADRFLSAAIVRGDIDRLEDELETKRATHASLAAEVASLESKLMDHFATKKRVVRAEWLEKAKHQAYEHAAEYEAKRFRSRNEDKARLKTARDELMTLTRLHLEGARALDPQLELEELARGLRKCPQAKTHIEALDCVNKLRWKVEETFAEARQKVGLSAQDTAALLTLLRDMQISFRWQNDSVAVVDDKLPLAAWKAILAKVVGPVQVHAARKVVPMLRNKLRAASLGQDRLATPITDNSEDSVVYLLAYPRPLQSDQVSRGR